MGSPKFACGFVPVRWHPKDDSQWRTEEPAVWTQVRIEKMFSVKIQMVDIFGFVGHM